MTYTTKSILIILNKSLNTTKRNITHMKMIMEDNDYKIPIQIIITRFVFFNIGLVI